MSSTSSLPLGPHTIHTPRLTLRTPISPADIPSLLAYFTDPAATSEQPQRDLTPDILDKRIEKWYKTRAEGTNAWLVVVLRNDISHEKEGDKIIGFGGYNSFPRTSILNSAERESDDVPDEDKVWAADIGMGIDLRYQRKVSSHSSPPSSFKVLRRGTKREKEKEREVMI